MTAIKAIAPILLVIALIAPMVTGYRRTKLVTSIWIGWILFVLAYASADFLIPGLTFFFHGQEACQSVVPQNSGTLPMLLFGWTYPLMLHFFGSASRELLDALHGLWLKRRSP